MPGDDGGGSAVGGVWCCGCVVEGEMTRTMVRVDEEVRFGLRLSEVFFPKGSDAQMDPRRAETRCWAGIVMGDDDILDVKVKLSEVSERKWDGV